MPKRLKIKRALRLIRAHSTLAIAVHNLKVIRGARAETTEQKVSKSKAILDLCIETRNEIKKILSKG